MEVERERVWWVEKERRVSSEEGVEVEWAEMMGGAGGYAGLQSEAVGSVDRARLLNNGG